MSFITDKLTDIWMWITALSFWICTISAEIMVIFYAVTKDQKFIQKIGIIIVGYLIFKGVDSVI